MADHVTHPLLEQLYQDFMQLSRSELADALGGDNESPGYAMAIAQVSSQARTAMVMLNAALERGIVAPGPNYRQG